MKVGLPNLAVNLSPLGFPNDTGIGTSSQLLLKLLEAGAGSKHFRNAALWWQDHIHICHNFDLEYILRVISLVPIGFSHSIIPRPIAAIGRASKVSPCTSRDSIHTDLHVFKLPPRTCSIPVMEDRSSALALLGASCLAAGKTRGMHV